MHSMGLDSRSARPALVIVVQQLLQLHWAIELRRCSTHLSCLVASWEGSRGSQAKHKRSENRGHQIYKFPATVSYRTVPSKERPLVRAAASNRLSRC